MTTASRLLRADQVSAVSLSTTDTDSKTHFLKTLVTIVCAAALAFPLLGYAYLGGFTRYVADDFCAGRNLAQHGFWGSQLWTYQNHSGRFFSYFARIGLAFLGRNHETSFIPAALMICWLAATAWAFWQFASVLGWRKHLLPSIVLSELIVFAMLRTAPDPAQSFYWQAGAFTYTVPIILITLYIGLIPYHLKNKSTTILMLAGVLAFCAAGTSETNAVLQCAGILAALIICKLNFIPDWNMRRALPMLYSGLVGSIISTVVVVIAPGNAVREAGVRVFTPALSRSAVITKSFWETLAYVGTFLHDRPLAALALVCIPAIFTWFQKSYTVREVQWPVWIKAWLTGWTFSLALIFCAIMPGVYALSALPPGRAQFVDHWIVLATLLLTGVSLGFATRNWYSAQNKLTMPLVALLVLALVLPWTVRSTRNNLAMTSDLRHYAAEWDAEDAQIRQVKSRGGSEVVLPWSSSVASGGNVDGIEWLSDDPSYWINTCTADYYGIKSLRTVSPQTDVRQKTALQVSP